MKSSKIFLLFCLLLGLFLMTGCGIEVSTDMTIDNDFNGSRVISCFVSKQDMKLHFKGDSSKIDTIIENNCPGVLEYTKNETVSGTEFVFTLFFDSLDDYKTQLSSVLHFSPEVTYKGINSLFSKSINLTENFTSIDLLRWFEILLTEEYSITESQLESLWDIEDNTVYWLDTTYTSQADSIQISEHTYSAFDGISIYTEEKDDRTFQRRIQFAIPTSTLNKRILELEKAFEEIKPPGTTGIWSVTSTGKVYELTFQTEDFETLAIKTGVALNSTVQAASNSTIDGYHYLKMQLDYSETLDFSYFLSTENGEVPVSYYFKPNSMTEINSERLQREINNAFIPKLYDNGYYRIFSDTCDSLNIRTLGTMTLPVTSYSIETTLAKEDQMKREFLFTFDNILLPEEKKLLKSVLTNQSNDTLSMDLKESNGDYIISITQKGKKDNINHSSGLLFGTENNNVVYQKQTFLQLLSNRKLTQISDSIDLTNFLGTGSETVQGEYILNDNVTQGIEEFYLESDSGTISYPDSQKAKTRSASITGTQFTVYYTGSEPSVIGILFLIILLLILIGAMIFFIKKHPISKTSENNE